MVNIKPLDIKTLLGDVKDFYSFSSEAQLNRLLLKNIDLFMEGVFGEKVKSATNKKSEKTGYTTLSTGQLLP